MGGKNVCTFANTLNPADTKRFAVHKDAASQWTRNLSRLHDLECRISNDKKKCSVKVLLWNLFGRDWCWQGGGWFLKNILELVEQFWRKSWSSVTFREVCITWELLTCTFLMSTRMDVCRYVSAALFNTHVVADMLYFNHFKLHMHVYVFLVC